LPIDKNEFVKGTDITSLQKQILEFLSKHNDTAYTPEEIADLLKPLRNLLLHDKYLSSVYASLDILLEEGKVVGKVVQTTFSLNDSRMDVYFNFP